MRVLFFWEPVGGMTLKHKCDPYAPLLAQALAPMDVHLELGDYAFEKPWLKQHRADYEVLHLHWLHYFYRRESLAESVAAYARFAENLTYAKRELGYKIVWTLHNVYPHERPFPELDHMARLLVCELADHVLCHCQYAADVVAELFYREDQVQVIPHGNFIDAFTNDISREDARNRLGISEDQFVYLFFGNARTYKGIEPLMDAFLETAQDDALLLLMMRKSFDVSYAESVETLSERDERIRVFTSPFFPESDFQVYINASDVCVFPFADVMTSGSAVAALSFGRPVILPRLGCLPELIDDRMGILYDAKAAKGLPRALADVRNMDMATAQQAAMDRAHQLNWEGIADKLAAVYRT